MDNLNKLYESVLKESIVKLEFADEETTQDVSDELKKNGIKHLPNIRKSVILFNNDEDKKKAKMILMKMGMKGLDKQSFNKEENESLSPLDKLYENVLRESTSPLDVLWNTAVRKAGGMKNTEDNFYKIGQQFMNDAKKDGYKEKEVRDYLAKHYKDASKYFKKESLSRKEQYYRVSDKDFNDNFKSQKSKGIVKKNVVPHLNVKDGDILTDKNRSGYWVVKESLSPLDKLHESVCKEAFTKRAVDIYNKIISKNKKIDDGELLVKMQQLGVSEEDAISVINYTKGWSSNYKKESLSSKSENIDNELKSFLKNTSKVDRILDKKPWIHDWIDDNVDIKPGEDWVNAVMRMSPKSKKTLLQYFTESLSPLDKLHESVLKEFSGLKSIGTEKKGKLIIYKFKDADGDYYSIVQDENNIFRALDKKFYTLNDATNYIRKQYNLESLSEVSEYGDNLNMNRVQLWGTTYKIDFSLAQKIKKHFKSGKELQQAEEGSSTYDEQQVARKLIEEVKKQGKKESLSKERLPGNAQIQAKIVKMIKKGYSQDEIKEETGYEISDTDYNRISKESLSKESVCKEDWLSDQLDEVSQWYFKKDFDELSLQQQKKVKTLSGFNWLNKESLSNLNNLHESVLKESNINNWKFTQRGDGGHEMWVKDGVRVTIESYSYSDGRIEYYVGVRDNNGIVETSKHFNNKADAVKYAKEYIKKYKESLSPLDKLYESVLKESFNNLPSKVTYDVYTALGNMYTELKKIKDEKAAKEIKEIWDKVINVVNKYKESLSPLDKLHGSVLKEELKIDSKHINKLKQNNVDFEKIGDELYVDESDSKRLVGLGIPYKESLSPESLKEAKDKNGKGILGGARVKTPDGKMGYVYQIMDNKIRVTSKPQTGLIGWFKPEELEVKESLSKEDFYPNFNIVKQKKDANGFIILEVTADDKKGAVDYARQSLGYKVRDAKSAGSNKYIIYTGNK